MFKKGIAILISAVILVGTFIFGISAKKEEKTYVTPNATELNLLSCRFTQEEPKNSPYDSEHLKDTVGYEVILENQNYALYYNKQTCNARVLDKQSGYMWGTISEEDKDYMNLQWREMAESLVTISYLDSECMSYRVSLGNEAFEVKYKVENNSVVFDAFNSQIGISFGFKITLLDDSLKIEMLEQSLVESGDYLLESMYFMPFFGTVRESKIGGYMFIPDGTGALIRYAESFKYISPYDQRVYGLDMAIDELKRISNLMSKRSNDYLTEQLQVTIPVYGMTHGTNKNAFLSVIENGAEYAKIFASPAGYVTDFNWATAYFVFRTTYHLSGGTGSNGIMVNQENPNNVLPSVRYFFLSGENANYSGMANTFKKYLKDNDYLSSSERSDKNIPLRIDVLGGDIKTGRLWDKYIPFTTVSEARDICESLYASDVTNLTFSYKGFLKGGLNGADYDELKVESNLGSIKELKKFKSYLSENNSRMFLTVNPITGNEKQIDYKKDGVLSQSKNIVYFQRDNDSVAFKRTYIVKPNLAVDVIRDCFKQLKDFNILFSEVGTRVYGDYSRERTILRNTTVNVLVKTLSSAKTEIALNSPNMYLWNQTSEYFDLPLENSQYLYETDTVPFLPMVLKGSIDYYTPYINQGYYTEDYILKMIEYGAYPSFLIMAAKNEKLSGTPSEDFFSLNFDDWKENIITTYEKMNKVLKETEALEMKSHTVVDYGIVRVDYTEGTSVLINYTDNEYTIGNITVPAKQCSVIKGE